MKKTILMLLGFAVVFSATVACFSPASKKDKTSPINSGWAGPGRLPVAYDLTHDPPLMD